MRKVQLLSTVAAALLFAAGAASAQDLKKNVAPEPAPAAQQKAPAEKVAPPMHSGQRLAPSTTGQASPSETDKSPGKGAEMPQNKPENMENKAGKTENNAGNTPNSDHAAKANESTKTNESAAGKSNATTGQGAASAARGANGQNVPQKMAR